MKIYIGLYARWGYNNCVFFIIQLMELQIFGLASSIFLISNNEHSSVIFYFYLYTMYKIAIVFFSQSGKFEIICVNMKDMLLEV